MYVYAIHEEHSGLFKIGRTNNVGKRIANFQVGNSSRLTVYFISKPIKCSSDELELLVHQKFRHCKFDRGFFIHRPNSGEFYTLDEKNLGELLRYLLEFGHVIKLPKKIGNLRLERAFREPDSLFVDSVGQMFSGDHSVQQFEDALKNNRKELVIEGDSYWFDADDDIWENFPSLPDYVPLQAVKTRSDRVKLKSSDSIVKFNFGKDNLDDFDL